MGEKTEEIYQGTFRGNEHGFGFVMPDNMEEKENDIHITKERTKGALNGDIVLVKVIDDSVLPDQKREGKIIKIIKRASRQVVGLFNKYDNFGFVTPDDKNFGSDIFISRKNFKKAKNGDKVVVEIVNYPMTLGRISKKAEGKIVEVLGNAYSPDVDFLSIVKAFSLPNEFPKEVKKEASSIETEISSEELIGRENYINEDIFTIDGDDAKDLDDAVQVKRLENGNYFLGVYIADVSNYVKEGSAINEEAFKRGTSVYMLNRVIPMLPIELSNNICSLNENQERLVLACLMEIDSKGNVVSSDVKKGIVKTKRRMTYTEVYEGISYWHLLDKDNKEAYNKTNNRDKKIKLNEEITINDIKYKNPNWDRLLPDWYIKYRDNFIAMEELAIILKNKRKNDGYLNLDIPETKIDLDENGLVINIDRYKNNFANEIIEQFMLITNETIAEKFFWLESPFVYRNHDIPDEDKVEELNMILFNMGYKINGYRKGTKESIKPKAFLQILDKIKGKSEEKVIATQILRTLKLAKYEAENRGHFGIGSKCYCHFTSPIRRYPDLFIHRIISFYLKNNYNVSEEFKEKYKSLAEKVSTQSSERERIAQDAERDSESLKMAEYMEDKVGERYDGVVSSITSFGMFVELPNTVEGLIRFEFMGNDYYIYDEKRKELIGDRNKKVYKIGDLVRIKVISANKQLRRIDFELVEDDELEEVNENNI